MRPLNLVPPVHRSLSCSHTLFEEPGDLLRRLWSEEKCQLLQFVSCKTSWTWEEGSCTSPNSFLYFKRGNKHNWDNFLPPCSMLDLRSICWCLCYLLESPVPAFDRFHTLNKLATDDTGYRVRTLYVAAPWTFLKLFPAIHFQQVLHFVILILRLGRSLNLSQLSSWAAEFPTLGSDLGYSEQSVNT